MDKIAPIEPETAGPPVRKMLDEVQERLGMIPNALRVMAHSPVVLQLAIQTEDALREGMLTPRIREQIALTVSELNGSRYCIAHHSALGGIAGLCEEEIEDARNGTSPDRHTEAALCFARDLVKHRGAIGAGRVDQLHRAGWKDAEIVEIIAQAAVTTLFNYVNRTAETESDFPEPAR